MIAYVLLVWFGAGNTQSSFAVSNIASMQECTRLGEAMKARKAWAQIECHPYRVATEPNSRK